MNFTTKEKHQLIEFLQFYLPFVKENTTFSINSGGCGIFACALYRGLKKLGLSPFIKGVWKYNSFSLESVRHFKIHNDFIGVFVTGPQHCVVKLFNQFFDSDGINTDKFEYIIGIKHDQLNDIAENYPDAWNDEFDRECSDMIETYLDNLDVQFELYKQDKKFLKYKELLQI